MITITDTAAKEIKRLADQQGLENAVLRVGVAGGGCSGLQYAMNFDQEVKETDQLFEYEGVQLVCDAKSYLYLSGITIDYTTDMMGGGFKFINPNAERSCGCGMSFST